MYFGDTVLFRENLKLSNFPGPLRAQTCAHGACLRNYPCCRLFTASPLDLLMGVSDLGSMSVFPKPCFFTQKKIWSKVRSHLLFSCANCSSKSVVISQPWNVGARRFPPEWWGHQKSITWGVIISDSEFEKPD